MLEYMYTVIQQQQQVNNCFHVEHYTKNVTTW